VINVLMTIQTSPVVNTSQPKFLDKTDCLYTGGL